MRDSVFFRPQDPTALSVRETEAAKLVAAGWGNTEIARMMCVSRETVSQHLNSVYSKMQARFDCKGRNMRSFLGVKYREMISDEAT